MKTIIQYLCLIVFVVGIFSLYTHYILRTDEICLIDKIESTCVNFWNFQSCHCPNSEEWNAKKKQ